MINFLQHTSIVSELNIRPRDAFVATAVQQPVVVKRAWKSAAHASASVRGTVWDMLPGNNRIRRKQSAAAKANAIPKHVAATKREVPARLSAKIA